MLAHAPIRGYCAPCSANSTFLGLACKRCGDKPDGVPLWRDDEDLPDSDYAAYEARYTATPRPQVSWRPLMSSRHVKNFYAETHEVFQGPPNDPNRFVTSRGQEQRYLESIGLDPDDGSTPLKDENGHDIF